MTMTNKLRKLQDKEVELFDKLEAIDRHKNEKDWYHVLSEIDQIQEQIKQLLND